MGVSTPTQSPEKLVGIEVIFNPDQSVDREQVLPLLEMSFSEISSLFESNFEQRPVQQISGKSGTYHIEMVTAEGELCVIIFRPVDKSFYINKRDPDHLIIEELESEHGNLKFTANGYPAFNPGRGKIVKLFS